MFRMFQQVTFIAAANAIPVIDERRRIAAWEEKHPGEKYEMKHHTIANTVGFYSPVKKQDVMKIDIIDAPRPTTG